MIIGLIIILLLVLTLPFFSKKVEQNLELFLFIMGLAATIVSGVLNLHLAKEIIGNSLLYLITGAVLVFGILFKLFKSRVKRVISAMLRFIPMKVFVFILIVFLGLSSSVATAIIASLLLVEVINDLPLKRSDKINLDIIACFSIGLGAVLTPIGEPLSTIVISRLDLDFWYLMREVGIYIFPGVAAMGLLGSLMVKNSLTVSDGQIIDQGEGETYAEVIIRAVKVFVFVMALELLGAGFKPVIDTYIVQLDSRILYWINMISSVLDNATLAAAEVSPQMTNTQIQAVLMGLLISGGMLIPGNIPNIISAGKLKITSKEWARLGVPLGLAVMGIYYIWLFVI